MREKEGSPVLSTEVLSKPVPDLLQKKSLEFAFLQGEILFLIKFLYAELTNGHEGCTPGTAAQHVHVAEEGAMVGSPPPSQCLPWV